MPQAMIAREFSGPRGLQLTEIPSIPPKAGEVTIAVRAIGVNPMDWKLLHGWFGRDETQLPAWPGNEVAGVVVAVGADALGPAGPVRVGDEVIGYRVEHGYASEVTVPATSVLPKPSSLDWPDAAALVLTGVTAMHLVEATGVSSGSSVIVHGAAGGVGFAAVQLALARGARVVGTASEAHHSLLREIGAEPVSYGEGLLARLQAVLPDGADAALDASGTDEALDASVVLVADRSRIATIAGYKRGAELGIRVLGAAPGGDAGVELRTASRLPVVERAGAGALRVRVARTFPLDRAAEALALVESGQAGGRVVLIP